MQRAIGSAVVAAIAMAGCAGNGEGLDENGQPIGAGAGQPPPLTATFESIQQNVFTPVCTTCHTGATAPAGLRLDADASYAMLVNAPSTEVPGLSRVLPGDPDNSYLIQKLEGNAAVGAPMPLNQPPLPQATIEVIRQWIAAGAPQATAAAAPSKPAMLTAVAPVADAILDAPPREILVTANAGLDVNLLNSGSVMLERSGKDGSFDEGNEVTLTPLHLQIRSFEPTVIAITLPAAQWVTDSYRLTISGGAPAAVADMGGRIIDGNADGTAGGDFVLYFDLLSNDAGVSL